MGEIVDEAWAAKILDRLEQLEADNRNLRAQVATLQPDTSAPSDPADGAGPTPVAPTTSPRSRPVSRRGLLLGAGAATAGAVALVAAPSPVAANGQGQSFTLGDPTNTATETTALSASFTNKAVLQATNNGTNGGAASAILATLGAAPGLPATGAVVGQSTFGIGVMGVSGNSSGVRGTSAIAAGLEGTGLFGAVLQGDSVGAVMNAQAGGYGLQASTTTGTAGVFIADGAVLRLQPNTPSRPAPATDLVVHARGEVVADAAGNLWYCTAYGTPGTWRKLSGPAAAGAFHVLPQPVRVYDSRPLTSPAVGSKTPLVANVARTLDCTVNSSGVPADATAVLATVLLVNVFNGNGNFTIWANGVAVPASNTMVWGAGSGRYTTTAASALDNTGKVQVRASATTDLVLDIVGYYR